jgi:hypothetical protein
MQKPALDIILGIALLIFGRVLYWLFIAIVGFLLGMELAQNLLADQQEWVRILVALGAGVLGALLAVFIQRLAFAIAGFFAGGYLAFLLALRLQNVGDPNIWSIAGGIIGAIIAALLMDWAIIVLSSLAGAAAIAHCLPYYFPQLDQNITLGIFAGLTIIGIAIQGYLHRGPTTPAAPPPPVV